MLGWNADPWSRRRVGLLLFVLTPAVFLGGGLLSASNALSRVIGPKAVSYTHLDVYKRQTLPGLSQ